MLLIFWLAVIIFATVYKKRQRRAVRLLYQAQPRIDHDTAIFACGCRFSLVDHDLRTLCKAHEAIVTAEVKA